MHFPILNSETPFDIIKKYKFIVKFLCTGICGSTDQGETLKNVNTYIDNEDISLLSSTAIPENTVEERTKINLSENSLTCKSIASNHDSDKNRLLHSITILSTRGVSY